MKIYCYPNDRIAALRSTQRGYGLLFRRLEATLAPHQLNRR